MFTSTPLLLLLEIHSTGLKFEINKATECLFFFCMTVFTQHKIWESFVWLPKYFDLLLNSIWMVEKAMAPHSSTPAWKIPWTEEPGRLQSMGSLRVGHDWVTWLSLFTFMHRRRKWQPTPVFAWRIPGTGEPCGLLSLGSHRVGHDWSDLFIYLSKHLTFFFFKLYIIVLVLPNI